jgi:hypothetical protein
MSRATIGHQRQDVPLPGCQQGERGVGTPALHESGHDRGVDHALALADALERVDEHRDVRYALLEQVARSLGCLFEQAHRVARLEVVRQHEHPDIRMAAPDLLRGDQPVVGVAGWHADVDDRHVRPGQRHAAQGLRCGGGFPDDVHAGLREQPRQTFDE